MAGRTSKSKVAEEAKPGVEVDVKALEEKIALLEKAVADLKAELASHCKKSEEEHKALAAKCDANANKPVAAASGNVDLSDLKKKLNQLVQQMRGRTKPGWPQF